MKSKSGSKRVQVNVRMPVEMKKQICWEIQKNGFSINDYILLAIQEKINHQEK